MPTKDRIAESVVIVAGLMFLAYLLVFSWNYLYTFHEDIDLGVYTFSMYYAVNQPGIVNGLQYIIFGNHIAPDQLMIVPLYYLYQSPYTLLAVQDLVLIVTAVSLFFVTRSLLGSNLLGIGFFAAFVLSPGIYGLITYNYHSEVFIPLFYLLTFYFYMKKDVVRCFAFLLLLLGTIEDAPAVAAMLAVGLLIYAYFSVSDVKLKKERMIMAIGILAVSILVFGVYYLIDTSLLSSYASGAYASLPPRLQMGSFATSLPHVSNPIQATKGVLASTNGQAIAFGIMIAVFGFGVSPFASPLILSVMISPWLAEVFLVGDTNFLNISFQNYGFVIGATFVSALLGILVVRERGSVISRLSSPASRKPGFKRSVIIVAFCSILATTLILNMMATPYRISGWTGPSLTRVFLFQGEYQPYVWQIDSMLKLVPANASLMTTLPVMSVAGSREYVEEMTWPQASYFFAPEYILADFDSRNISLEGYMLSEQKSYLTGYITDNAYNYTLYARNGSAFLLKRTGYGNATTLIQVLSVIQSG